MVDHSHLLFDRFPQSSDRAVAMDMDVFCPFRWAQAHHGQSKFTGLDGNYWRKATRKQPVSGSKFTGSS